MGAGKFGAMIAMVGGLIGLVPGHAGAAALTFNDISPNETVTVSVCDFEAGASVNGTSMGHCGVGAGGSVTLAESGGPITFFGRWIDLGQSGAGSRTIYLVEAGAPTLISDIFTYDWSTDGFFATIHAVFESDITGNLGALPSGVNPGDVYVENGQPVPFSLAYLGGELISGADVPEPGSVALVELGLAGVASSRRRKA